MMQSRPPIGQRHGIGHPARVRAGSRSA